METMPLLLLLLILLQLLLVRWRWITPRPMIPEPMCVKLQRHHLTSPFSSQKLCLREMAIMLEILEMLHMRWEMVWWWRWWWMWVL